MNKFKSGSVGKKIKWGYIVIITIMILNLSVIIFIFKYFSDTNKNIIHSIIKLNNIKQTLNLFTDNLKEPFTIQETLLNKDDCRKQLTEVRDNINKDLKYLDQITESSDIYGKSKLATIYILNKAYYKKIEDGYLKSKNISTKDMIEVYNSLKNINDLLTLECKGLISKQLTNAENAIKQIDDKFNMLIAIILILIVIIILFLFIFSIRLSNYISNTLNKLSKASEIIGRGNLTGDDVIIKSNDELQILAKVFNKMKNNLRAITEKIHAVISEENPEAEEKFSVTSDDKTGDLVVAFNKIQERVKDNIRQIREAQEMLMERERLASLGQLIGGIAHNINTPIMSIAGGLEALQDLASEYDESIEDENVTKKDHHEIAAEILDWVKKIKPYCAHMSDVIAAVKGQAVHLGDSTTDGFTLGELVKRVEILMDSELKRHKCKINIDLNVDVGTELRGEVNSLVQVISNLVMNAIDAYKGEEGVVYLKIDKKGDGKSGGNKEYIEFSVKDYGSGIPEEVQQKLLKEMVTTKGKDGTGLGLFMSYLTVRGRFGGDMRFESEEGKGTTFYITVPLG